MDPNETFRMIVNGMLELSTSEDKNFRADLCIALCDLSDWIERDGFIPPLDSLESTLIENLPHHYIEKRVL